MVRPRTPVGGPCLTVTSLSVSFGGLRAIDAVNLEVQAGTIKAIIGPNGSGKSTLLNVISRFVDPDAGRISFGGRDLLRSRPEHLAGYGVGRTFQSPLTFGGLTLVESVLVGMQATVGAGLMGDLLRTPSYRGRLALARSSAEKLLLLVGFGEGEFNRPSQTLNFAAQRRAELARALGARPLLLLLDEPAAGLDDKEAASLGEILRRVSGWGTATLVVEHNIGFVRQFADSLTVLDQGRVILEGRPDEVIGHERLRTAYLGSRFAQKYRTA